VPFEVSRVGNEIRVEGSGRVDVDEAIAGVEDVRTVDPNHESTHTILDLTEVDVLDASVEGFHQLALAIRRIYARGPEYRFAFAVSSPIVASMTELFVDVRDLLTAQQVSSLPEIGMFATVEEARSWASADLGPPVDA